MKSFAVVLLAVMAEGISVHNLRQANAPTAADTSCQKKNPGLVDFTIEDLEAEIAERKKVCAAAPAPTPSHPAPGPAPLAQCSAIDGTAASDVYPCACGDTVCKDDLEHCHNGKCMPAQCSATDGLSASDIYPCTCGEEICKGKTHNCKDGKCVAPPDNFVDEIVDQANVDFGMMDADKSGCISAKEMSKTLRDQVKAAEGKGYYWQEKHVTKGHDHMEDEVKDKIDSADADGNGCLNKEEFEKVQKAFNQCSKQFVLMDVNGDGKVSRQESANYVSHHMDHADLNYSKLRAIFEAADMNKDNYLTEQEFCTAGQKYEGDGNKKL